jgi:hypothetical protein
VSLTIRVADLGTDRDLIIDTLRRFLTPLSDATRFEWLYRANPYGPAAAWIAVDGAHGETIGMASAFPRRAVRDGREERCWVLGDFCIHERYRTLGPALSLNRACLAGVDRGDVAFCYDFPSDRMMAVYRRLGIHPFGQMIRFAKVLRWGRKLRDMVPIPGVRTGAELLGGIADFVSARTTAPPQGTVVAVETRDCDRAYDDLDRANRQRFQLHLERSAAYLNWRYRANPLHRYEILAARREGELRGYAVFSQTGSHGLLTDLVALDDDTTRLLLDELAVILRARKAGTLSAPAISSHSLVPHLLRSGFRPRETGPAILYRQPHPESTGGGDDWPLLYGDRDS